MAWNDTYTEGMEWQTPAVYQMFVQAINERIEACSNLLTVTPLDEDLEGEEALTVLGATGWWAMMNIVANMAAVYINASEELEGIAVGSFNLPWVRTDNNWPNGTGFTRKREREITSLSASGIDGQRARFTTHMFLTPFAQVTNGTKIFDRVSGAWILSADQITPPDVVTLYGLPQAGDLFGPWILNELRDAINELTVVPYFNLETFWYRQKVSNESGDQITATGTSDAESAAALEAALVDAANKSEVELASATISAWTQATSNTASMYRWTGSGTNTSPRKFTGSAIIDWKEWKGNIDLSGVPNHRSREVKIYFSGRKPDQAQAWPLTFDSDFGIQEGAYTLIHTVEGSSVTTIDTPVIGDLSATPTRPPQPALADVGTSSSSTERGFSFDVSVYRVRWDVTGGFQYTSAS